MAVVQPARQHLGLRTQRVHCKLSRGARGRPDHIDGVAGCLNASYDEMLRRTEWREQGGGKEERTEQSSAFRSPPF